jgi:hypothetical protein
MANYLYNGVELPALPDYDKTKFPYAYIITTNYENHPYHLRLYTSPFLPKSGDTQRVYILEDSTMDDRVWYLGADNWSGRNENHVDNYDDNKTPLWNNERYSTFVWANTDILNADGSIYLAASDPVPVLALTDSDLYRKINGQPTKLTLYKKVSDKLVALDEYSAVSATAVQSNT